MRGSFEEPPTRLIPWFSKTEGNTYATIAASPFPLQGKPTQAQDVAPVSTVLYQHDYALSCCANVVFFLNKAILSPFFLVLEIKFASTSATIIAISRDASKIDASGT